MVGRQLHTDQVIVPTLDASMLSDDGITSIAGSSDPRSLDPGLNLSTLVNDHAGIATGQGPDLRAALVGSGQPDGAEPLVIGPSKITKGSGGLADGDGSLGLAGPAGGGGFRGTPIFRRGPGNAKKIVFVLDATGSMIPVFDALRGQVHRAIEILRPPQSFNVVFINEHNPAPLAPALLFATPDNKRKAIDYVDTMAPRGGTNPLPALKKAFALGPEIVYFLIDPSDFPDKHAVLELVNSKAKGGTTKLNVIAFNGHDPENERFLQDLAKSTGGVYSFVTDVELRK
jgi:hypothetical protein